MLSENKISIKRNFIYSVTLTISQYIFPLIIFPYITRILGSEYIGKVEFVDSLVSYFVLFSSLGINILGIREVSRNRNDAHKLNQTFSSLLFIHALFTFVFLIIYILVIVFYFEKTVYKELIIIGSGKLVFSFLLIEWLYKGLENFKLITLRTIAIKLVYLASIFLLVKSQNDYIIYWILTVLTVIINALINIILSKKFVRLNLKNISLSLYLKSYISLGLYLIFTSFYTTFNIVFLGFSGTPDQVGYYTTAIKIYGVLLGFYTAFTNVMLPRMSHLISSNNITEFDSIIRKSFVLLFMAGIPILIFSYLYSEEIVNIIAGAGFEKAIPVLQIVLFLIIGVGIGQICSVQVLIPFKKDKQILFISIAGACLGVILNIILVKKHQSIGSAYVLLISETLVSALLLVACYVYAKIKIPITIILKNILVYLPFMALLWIFKMSNEFYFVLDFFTAGVITVLYIFLVQYYILKNELIVQFFEKFNMRK